MITVQVLSTKGLLGNVTIENENPTGLDLKNALRDQLSFDLNNIRLILRSTKADVTLDQAVLPTEDFTILAVAASMKLGSWDDQEEDEEEIVQHEVRSNVTTFEGAVAALLDLLEGSDSPIVVAIKEKFDNGELKNTIRVNDLLTEEETIAKNEILNLR